MTDVQEHRLPRHPDLELDAVAARVLSDPTASERRVLLRGGYVLSMDDAIGDVEGGDVLLVDGAIAAVGTSLGLADVEIDCSSHVVLPGFVNSHVHMFQSALRSYWVCARTIDYFSQSRQGRGAILHRYLPSDVYLGQLVGSAEHLTAGVTTIVDTSQCTYTPEHTDSAITGLADSGIRAVYAYSPTTGWDHGDGVAHPHDLGRLLDRHFPTSSGLVTPAMGCPPDAELWALARHHKLPIFSHVNSAPAGLELESLGRSGAMGTDNTYIHCTGLESSTWDAIARSGGRASISNIVEQSLGFASPGLHPALACHVPTGFSTDGPSLGPSDMFSHMKVATVLLRGPSLGAGTNLLANDVTPHDILEVATIGGARAAHLDDIIGSITPGKRADIVLLNRRTLNAWPAHDPAGSVALLMDTSNVSSVLVDGIAVKWAGKLTALDTEALLSDLESSADGLLGRSGYPSRSVPGWRAPDPE